MDNIFLLNPSLSELDLQDATDERFIKIRAIISGLLATQEGELKLDRDIIYQMIWTIQDFTDEIEVFRCKIKKSKRRYNYEQE
ncbi:MAG: hypothetical protein PVG30_08570 [Gammaproteobacteria bacterium]|jgi:hypothetical protein